MTMEYENKMALPEYARAKMMVCWDIDNCPIPEGFNPELVGPRIKSALRKLDYTGPLTIRAIGNLHKVVGEETLKKLSSSGIALRHRERIGSFSREYMEWRRENKGPVSIMLITHAPGVKVMSITLSCMEANNLLAYPTTIAPRRDTRHLVTTAEWVWSKLLNDGVDDDTRRKPLVEESDDTCDMLRCDVCDLNCKSFVDFAKHLERSKTGGGINGDSGDILTCVQHVIGKRKKKGSLSKQYKLRNKQGLKALEIDEIMMVLNQHREPAFGELREGTIAVFWDIENCNPSKKLNPDTMVDSLSKSLQELGYRGPVRLNVVCGYQGLNNAISPILKERLERLDWEGSITFTVAKSFDGNAANLSIVDLAQKWMKSRTEKSIIMLISSDGYFLEPIKIFQSYGCETLLSFNPNFINNELLNDFHGPMWDYRILFT